MLFLNPLSPLQHMGGFMFIHASMAIRGIFVMYNLHFEDLAICDEIIADSKFFHYDDFVYVVIAHIVCLLFMLISWWLSSPNYTYLRSLLSLTQMGGYMLSIFYI